VPQAPRVKTKVYPYRSRAEEKRPLRWVEAAAEPRGETKVFSRGAALFFLALFLPIAAGFPLLWRPDCQWLGHWKTFDGGSAAFPARSARRKNLDGCRVRPGYLGSKRRIFTSVPAGQRDLKLRARVLSLERTDSLGQAGLMDARIAGAGFRVCNGHADRELRRGVPAALPAPQREDIGVPERDQNCHQQSNSAETHLSGAPAHTSRGACTRNYQEPRVGLAAVGSAAGTPSRSSPVSMTHCSTANPRRFRAPSSGLGPGIGLASKLTRRSLV